MGESMAFSEHFKTAMLTCRNNFSSFYKNMHNDSEMNLKLPSKFVHQVKGQLGQTAMLQGPCDMLTKVEVCYKDNAITFENGWKEFVFENYIEYGDLLLFHYKGNSKFVVTIYDRTCCEKGIAFKLPKDISMGCYDSKCNKPRYVKEDLQASIRNKSPPSPLIQHKQVTKLSKDVENDRNLRQQAKDQKGQVDELTEDFQHEKCIKLSMSSTDDIQDTSDQNVEVDDDRDGANIREKDNQDIGYGKVTKLSKDVENDEVCRQQQENHQNGDFDEISKDFQHQNGVELSHSSTEDTEENSSEDDWNSPRHQCPNGVESERNLDNASVEPNFDVIMKKSNAPPFSRLTFPAYFCRSWITAEVQNVILLGPDKTESSGHLGKSNRRCYIYQPWADFYSKYCLRIDDICHFRMIHKNPLTLEVTIISRGDSVKHAEARSKISTEKIEKEHCQEEWEPGRGFQGKKSIKRETNILYHGKKRRFLKVDYDSKAAYHTFPKRKKSVTARHQDHRTEAKHDCFRGDQEAEEDDDGDWVTMGQQVNQNNDFGLVTKLSKGIGKEGGFTKQANDQNGQFAELTKQFQHKKVEEISDSSTDDISRNSSEDDLNSPRHKCANGIRSEKNTDGVSGNPYFEATMTKPNAPPISRLTIPIHFCVNWIPDEVKEATLLGPDRIGWPGSLRKDGQYHQMHYPWRDFYSHYNLRRGDMCHFELVNKNPLTLKATFNKCKRKGDIIRNSEKSFKGNTKKAGKRVYQEHWEPGKDFQGKKGANQAAVMSPHGKKKSFSKFNSDSRAGHHAFSKRWKLKSPPGRHLDLEAKGKTNSFTGVQEVEVDNVGAWVGMRHKLGGFSGSKTFDNRNHVLVVHHKEVQNSKLRGNREFKEGECSDSEEAGASDEG